MRRQICTAIVFAVLAVTGHFKVASATINCIAYEPFSNKNYPNKIYDALYGDLDIIKKQGFSCIKTYYSQFVGLNIAEVAHNMGLKVVMGIRMEEGAGLLNAEVAAAITACNTYPDTVLAIYAGNENLPNANPQDIISVRNRIKEKCSKPFGTVQTLGYWLKKETVAWDVFWAVDWRGYNVYSFFGPLGGKNSVDAVRDQATQLRNAYSDVFDTTFFMTETGWPSDGGSFSGNAANYNNAKSFADGLANMICDGSIKGAWMSYFIYNDPAYKQNVPEFERHFGVASPEGTPKWDLSRLSRCGAREAASVKQFEAINASNNTLTQQAEGPFLAGPQHGGIKHNVVSSTAANGASRKLKGIDAVKQILPSTVGADSRGMRLPTSDVAQDAITRPVTRSANGGPSKVQIYNACKFDVTADLLTPQPAGHDIVRAGQWKEIQLWEGNKGWVWKLYINGQASKPIQYEFSYDQGKLWYDLSYIDSFGSDLEKFAMTLTSNDGNCHPQPNCFYTRCPSAYNPDGSKACSIYQAYYPDHKCCYPGEPSYAAVGGTTLTLTLC